MPISREYFREKGQIAHSVTGTITDDELLENNRQLMAFLKENEHYRFVLADWSQVAKLDISINAIQAMARKNVSDLKSIPGDGFFAIVASKNITYGLARVWQSWATDINWDVQLFKSRTDAESWLNKKMDKPI